ncbi:MAG: 50S ribosomal protein L21 [Patescibacteria group bacterium]|jgi:large subunit ribosomal protein L21
MIAVVQTGGKQYVVKEQTKLRVEKLAGAAGDSVTLEAVLLTGAETGADVKFGTPLVSGAKVVAIIVKQGRAKKVTSMKFKNKVRYRRTLGHRQAFTEIKIEKINA